MLDARSRDSQAAEEAQLLVKDWEEHCPRCGEPVEPVPTHEEKPINPTSVYAVSKLDQELLCLSVGAGLWHRHGRAPVLQHLRPSPGVVEPVHRRRRDLLVALLNGKSPLVFEDGRQLRDFIHVTDTARAVVRDGGGVRRERRDQRGHGTTPSR